MKKKLLITLSVIFLLWMILLVVQIIDQKVNGEDYEKIHIFGSQFKQMMLEENECTTNLENVLSALIEENTELPDDNISLSVLNNRAQACYLRAEEFNNIQVPAIKNTHKKDIMYKTKKEFAKSIANWGNVINIYIDSKQNNSQLDVSLLLNTLNFSANLQKKLFIDALELYMTYSIKDIFITRPFLFYSKWRLH